MRILVCGGRNYDKVKIVNACLDTFKQKWGNITIIQGGARGADRLACAWAKRNNVPCEQFDAEWSKNGRAAGPIRNQQMIDEGKPDLFVAFPGGAGTADMVARLRKANISGTVMLNT